MFVYELQESPAVDKVGTPRARELARTLGITLDEARKEKSTTHMSARNPVLQVRSRCGLGAEQIVYVPCVEELAAASAGLLVQAQASASASASASLCRKYKRDA
mmetsp:Transcript_9084/g.23933  ORF Transcript_9084/g.23933 Transcript_9084/m.23933 type:complete len:104 (+) Transcript_9084:216-527(+)